MAEGDIDYRDANNIDCTYEDADGKQQRASLNVDPQVAGVLSADRASIVSQCYSEKLVMNGSAYSIRQKVNVVDGATAYFLFDISGYSGDVLCRPVRFKSSLGMWDIGLTTDFSYTAADTSPPILNRYGFTETGVNLTNVFTNITGLVVSSTPAEYRVGTDATNQAGGGGSSAGTEIWVMEQGNYYLLSMTNSSGDDDSVLSVQFDFYEE